MKCVECGAIGESFHRHHVSYKDNKTVILCPSCHRKVHANKKHRLYPVDKRPFKIPKYVFKNLENKIRGELEEEFLERERKLLYLENELELGKKDFEEHKNIVKKRLYDKKKHLDWLRGHIERTCFDKYSANDKIEMRRMADKIISLEYKIEKMEEFA